MPSVYKKLMKGWFKRLFHFRNKTVGSALYFTHIPKTAGTSFIVLLDRFFHTDAIFPYQLWRETKQVDVKHNQQYELFRGHFGGGGVSVLTDRNIQYLTILRTPASLALSTYEFVKREPNTKVHQLLKDQNMTFTDFMQHPVTASLVKNRMIRNISFDFVEDSAAQEVFLSAETITYLQNIINNQKASITDAERLVRSKKFIDACSWFGMLERFDESMQLLCYSMAWPPIGQSQKLNTYKKKPKLTAAEQKALELINAEDLALYEYASEIFKQKVAAMKVSLEKWRSNNHQSVDDLLDAHYQYHQSHQKTKLSAPYTYDFSQKLMGQQWHRRELMQPENEYFRWTGPDAQASLDFWVKPQDFTIKIRIINATSPDIIESLGISINGQAVEWYSSESGVVRVLTLSCPKEFIKHNGLLRLGFKCQTMVSHQQAFGSHDERLVGVAIHWIQLCDV